MLRGTQLPDMTTKKLEKLARQHGWIKHRNGSKHMVYHHQQHQDKIILIPYSVRPPTGIFLAKQLAI